MTIDDENAFPMDPAEIARLIDIPLEQWPANCHGVAEAIKDRLPVEGMRLARGQWLGPVSRRSVYRGGAMQQHTWLKLADGRVLDPTRWAMCTPGNPSIYLGVCDEYDEGGRQVVARLPPPFPGGGPNGQQIAVARMDGDARTRLASILCLTGYDDEHQHAHDRLATALRHAVHEDPDRQPNVEPFYRFAQDNGLKAMLPIDSWMRVMDLEAISCSRHANLYYKLPPAPVLSDQEVLFKVLNHFLSIESRDDFENDLAAFDIEISEFWDALNILEANAKEDLPLRFFPSKYANVLCLAAGDYLGQGFGQELKVERFAESIGCSPQRLDEVLRALGERCGYTLGWDLPIAPSLEQAAENSFAL